MSAPAGYSGTILPPVSGPNRPPRPAGDVAGQRTLAQLLWRDVPGQWTDNRYEQANHFRNLPYIAVRAIYTALAGGTITAYKEATSRREVRQLKAVGISHAQPGQDERLIPLPKAHPLAKLLRRPSQYDTFSRLVADWVIQRNLTGTALMWPVLSKLGKPCALYVVPTAAMQYVPLSPQYPAGGWRVTNTLLAPMFAGYGAGWVFDRSDVIEDRLPHPLYRWDGYSPLTAGGVQIDLLEQIDQARHAAMRHGVTPDALLSLPGASPDQIDRIEQQFRNAYAGSQNHRKVLVSDGEKVNASLLNTAPKDMDFAAGWEQMTKFVLALFGVPPSVAGLTEPGNYASFYAALQQFNANTLSGLCREFGELLTVHLAQKYWGDGYEVRLSLPQLKNEEAEEAKFQADRTVGLRTFNEERTARDLSPVPDGDVPAPLYLQRATMAAQQAMQPPPGLPGEAPGTDAPEAGADPSAGDAPWQTEEEAQAGIAEVAAGLLAGEGDDEEADEDSAPQVKAAGDYREGEVKTDKAGRKYKVVGGKRVPVGDGRGGPARPVGRSGTVDDRGRHRLGNGTTLAKRAGGSAPADRNTAATLHARLADHLAGGGRASIRENGRTVGIHRVAKDGQVVDANGVRRKLRPGGSEVVFHPKPAGKPAKPEKLTIVEASRRLTAVGVGRIVSAPILDRSHRASYHVEAPDGSRSVMTAAQIKQAIASPPAKPPATAALHARVAQHLAGGGSASLWLDGKRVGIHRVAKDGQVIDANGVRRHLGRELAGVEGDGKTGVEFHPPAKPAPAAGGRDNPLLDEAFGQPAAQPTKPAGGLRDNDLLDEALGRAAPQVAQRVAPQIAQRVFSTADQWAGRQAKTHAARVAAATGMTPRQAEAKLAEVIRALCAQAAQTGGAASHSVGGVKLTVRKKGAGTPDGGPPRPANPAGQGSLPPQPKAMSADPEYADPAPYGYCPECRQPAVWANRGKDGPVGCGNGHEWPRSRSKYASTQVNLPAPLARVLTDMAARIPDADLGEDGREDEPHVTVRYGLHADDPATVVHLVAGFGPVRVGLGRLNAFRGAATGKPYDVIFAEVDSPDLHALNRRLADLPHTDTWPEYKPHATVAYVKAGLADKWIAALGPVNREATVSSLRFSTADRKASTIPLSPQPKAMSAYADGCGGALVAPAGVPARRRRMRRLKRFADRLVKALPGGDDSEDGRVDTRRPDLAVPPTHFYPKEEGGRENPYTRAAETGDDPTGAGWVNAPATSHVYRSRLSLKKTSSAVFTRPLIYVQFRKKDGSAGDVYEYELSSNQIAQNLFDKIVESGRPYSEVVKPHLRDAHVPYTRVGNG